MDLSGDQELATSPVVVTNLENFPCQDHFV